MNHHRIVEVIIQEADKLQEIVNNICLIADDFTNVIAAPNENVNNQLESINPLAQNASKLTVKANNLSRIVKRFIIVIYKNN